MVKMDILTKKTTITLSESLLKNNQLAMDLHTLGMTPKCIDEFVSGTYNNVRRFRSVSPNIKFSRGSSPAWTFKKLGFKFSNILFKLYVNVSGDKRLSKEPSVQDIISTWSAVQIIYPEIIIDQICDITRFSYLIRGIIDHNYFVETCSNKNCKSQFIHHYSYIKKECWCCIEKREFSRALKFMQPTMCDNQEMYPGYIVGVDNKQGLRLVSDNGSVPVCKHLPVSVGVKVNN